MAPLWRRSNDPEKIRDVIGKGGAMIVLLRNKRVRQFDLDDDGTVDLCG